VRYCLKKNSHPLTHPAYFAIREPQYSALRTCRNHCHIKIQFTKLLMWWSDMTSHNVKLIPQHNSSENKKKQEKCNLQISDCIHKIISCEKHKFPFNAVHPCHCIHANKWWRLLRSLILIYTKQHSTKTDYGIHISASGGIYLWLSSQAQVQHDHRCSIANFSD